MILVDPFHKEVHRNIAIFKYLNFAKFKSCKV
jgi:hypothetical protein